MAAYASVKSGALLDEKGVRLSQHSAWNERADQNWDHFQYLLCLFHLCH